jgi:hypothetical protein
MQELKNAYVSSSWLIRKINIFILCIIAILFLRSTPCIAQDTLDFNSIKNTYKGHWYNKETDRHLQIDFDDHLNYMDVNDWIGNRKKADIDLYKAFVENGILILPRYNDQLHSCYCEIKRITNVLEYTCNEGLNVEDNYLNFDKPTHQVIFKKVK